MFTSHGVHCVLPSGVLEAPDLIRLDTAEDGCIEGLGKHGHLWHRLDKSFRQPRAYVRVVLGTPVVRDGGSQASEHAAIMSDVLSKVLARKAGLTYFHVYVLVSL